jgi:hypothetical protein
LSQAYLVSVAEGLFSEFVWFGRGAVYGHGEFVTAIWAGHAV